MKTADRPNVPELRQCLLRVAWQRLRGHVFVLAPKDMAAKTLPCHPEGSQPNFFKALGLVLLLASFASAGERFIARYDNQTLDADFADNVPINCLTGGQLTRGRHGHSGEGAIVAAWRLEDFAEAAGDAAPPPMAGLKYNIGDLIDPRGGSVEMWVKPYFNGKPTTSAGAFSVYYLFDCGNPNPKQIGDRMNGIQIYISESHPKNTRILTAGVTFANGQKAQVTCVVDWKPRTWHRFAFTWDEKSLALVVDGRRAAEKPAQGPLKAPEDAFFVGSTWFRSWPAQAVIDDVKIIAPPRVGDGR